MEALIKITETNGKQAVSAKELYEKLGFAPQHWANWYKKNIIDNSFAIENEDFIQLPLSGRSLDFALSIDFAKKIAMLARTEVGEQIRNYFIEIEKKVQTTLPATYKDALLALVAKIEEQEHTQALLEAKTEELDESKAWYTIKRRAMIKGINWRVYNWRELKRLSILADIHIKKVFDANYGEVNLYHLSIFEKYEKTLNK